MSAKILIVEDSKIQQMIIEKAIRMTGFDVGQIFLASDGIEGLSVLKSNKVDIILTDINMPKMDGILFISTVRGDKSYSKIPIVVITTEATKDKHKELDSYGINGFIKKPYNAETVFEALKGINAITISLGKNNSIIEEAVKNVFETMVFMDVKRYKPEDDVVTDREEPLLSGVIRLKGGSTGKISFTCYRSFARQILINITGSDISDEDVQAKINDTVGEIINMIAGDIKVRLAFDKDLFDLTPPVVTLSSGTPLSAQWYEGVNMIFVYEKDIFSVNVLI